MKIDVEGFECEVMAGAEALLQSNQVAAFIIEKGHAYSTEPAHTQFSGLLDRLTQAGYQHFTLHRDPTTALKENDELSSQSIRMTPYELSTKNGDILSIKNGFDVIDSYRLE